MLMPLFNSDGVVKRSRKSVPNLNGSTGCQPVSGVVELGNDTCLIGHDGWADGRFGDYAGSKVLLNVYLKIHNFVRAGENCWLALLNSLGLRLLTTSEKSCRKH